MFTCFSFRDHAAVTPGRTASQKKRKEVPSKGLTPEEEESSLEQDLSGLPNANAKSPRFTYAISQIATLPPVAVLNRKSQL